MIIRLLSPVMDRQEKFWVSRLDAFKSRKTAARKDKDVADATMDNLLSSFQVVHYREEEEKTIFQVVLHSFLFPPVSLSIPAAFKISKGIPLLTYDCAVTQELGTSRS